MAHNSQASNEGPASHQQPWLPAAPPPPPRARSQKLIQKVPTLFLNEKGNEDNYFPRVVSIGPYHHGKRELRLAEYIKPQVLKIVISGNKEKEDYYHQEIKKKIFNIRNCYQKNYIESYSDDELVRMMLLDACFIIIHMEMSCIEGDPKSEHQRRVARNAGFMVHTLGMLSISIVPRDMFLLENQIPLWIVKLLLESRYEETQGEKLLHRYMTRSLFGEFPPELDTNSPCGKQEELHLLEAFYRLVVSNFVDEPKKTCFSFINCKFLCCCQAKGRTISNPNTDIESGVCSHAKSRFRSCMNDFTCGRLFGNRNNANHVKGDLKKLFYLFRSVTDLKANGIHFKPSRTFSLKDVKFESNCIYGKLHLPIWCVSTYTKVFFINMIAYELSPINLTQAIVTSYINLMKSLVVRPEDVKELREKKILFCTLGSEDVQILKMYQDINTYGANNPVIFKDVIDKIQAHNISRRKIWIAEFLRTYFHSPWSAATLFAATCVLVLTFLQTIYTMKS